MAPPPLIAPRHWKLEVLAEHKPPWRCLFDFTVLNCVTVYHCHRLNSSKVLLSHWNVLQLGQTGEEIIWFWPHPHPSELTLTFLSQKDCKISSTSVRKLSLMIRQTSPSVTVNNRPYDYRKYVQHYRLNSRSSAIVRYYTWWRGFTFHLHAITAVCVTGISSYWTLLFFVTFCFIILTLFALLLFCAFSFPFLPFICYVVNCK